MALTLSFRDTVATRVKRDPAFREALLTEAVQALIAGEPDIGKSVLRDYINVTIGFPRLSELTATPGQKPDADGRPWRQSPSAELVLGAGSSATRNRGAADGVSRRLSLIQGPRD